MQLKLSNGRSEREDTINDIEGKTLTGVQGVYQSQSIALKWINDNLAGEWIIRRLYCGPPKRNI